MFVEFVELACPWGRWRMLEDARGCLKILENVCMCLWMLICACLSVCILAMVVCSSVCLRSDDEKKEGRKGGGRPSLYTLPWGPPRSTLPQINPSPDSGSR